MATWGGLRDHWEGAVCRLGVCSREGCYVLAVGCSGATGEVYVPPRRVLGLWRCGRWGEGENQLVGITGGHGVGVCAAQRLARDGRQGGCAA